MSMSSERRKSFVQLEHGKHVKYLTAKDKEKIQNIFT